MRCADSQVLSIATLPVRLPHPQILRVAGALRPRILPVAAQEYGLRPLDRHSVRTVGGLLRSGRRQTLLSARGNFHLNRLVCGAGWLGPGHCPSATRGAARTRGKATLRRCALASDSA